MCNIEAQRYTHSRSSGSTDGSRKGRTSDSSQHFKKVVCCRRRGKRLSTQNKKLYPTVSGPRAILMTSTIFFFFLLSTQLQLRALSMVKSAHVNETDSLETDSLSSEISTLLNTLGWNRDDIVSWYKVRLPYYIHIIHIISYPFLI